MLLDSVLGKALFCTCQILFYAVRPLFVYRLPVTEWHVANIAAQVVFDVALVRFAGGRALGYLVLSSFLAGSLHPCAAHFIAEHYVFAKTQTRGGKSGRGVGGEAAKGVPLPETYSYYGPLNVLTYNVGLHNEHHDFPAIPWTRLPRLSEMARDFYDELPCHKSWVLVMWHFILDPEVGLWCRVKRKEGGRKVGAGAMNDGWKEEELGAGEKAGKHIPGVK